MAKKYKEISLEVESKKENFYKFLENALEGEAFDFIKSLSLSTEVYLFSGIIRNYFLHNYLIRDVDLVLNSKHGLEDLLKKIPYKMNSFGGYKFELGSKKFDVWMIDKTWALNVEKRIDWKLFSYLPKSVFFNFSAVIYSINKKEFIYSNDFIKFLSKKEIDYVFKENLKKDLCIVNTVYYSEKYNLKISTRLKDLVQIWQEKYRFDLIETQKNHFGRVIYSEKNIYEKLEIKN